MKFWKWSEKSKRAWLAWLYSLAGATVAGGAQGALRVFEGDTDFGKIGRAVAVSAAFGAFLYLKTSPLAQLEVSDDEKTS